MAKWLRILGFDTAYYKSGAPQDLLERARREGRRILTRSEDLKRRDPSEVVLLKSEFLFDQIQQVLEDLKLRKETRPFTRCSECNTPLEPRSREEARGRVPFFVYQTQTKFGYCPQCDRVYWEGTHHKEMVKQLERLGY